VGGWGNTLDIWSPVTWENDIRRLGGEKPSRGEEKKTVWRTKVFADVGGFTTVTYSGKEDQTRTRTMV